MDILKGKYLVPTLLTVGGLWLYFDWRKKTETRKLAAEAINHKGAHSESEMKSAAGWAGVAGDPLPTKHEIKGIAGTGWKSTIRAPKNVY